MTQLLRILVAVAAALAGCRDLSDTEHDTPDAAAADAPGGDAAVDTEDGAPVRQPCTDSFGSALTAEYGRLDGILVAIVRPGSGPCNADSGHVHLQVRVDSAVYDVAINVEADVLSARREVAVGA